MSEKMLLILDIDETLVFATEGEIDHSSDFHFSKFSVRKRPFLDEFLARTGPGSQQIINITQAKYKHSRVAHLPHLYCVFRFWIASFPLMSLSFKRA